MWEIGNVNYVNKFCNYGRDSFLHFFCKKYNLDNGGSLKPEYQYGSLDFGQYFPYIVAAAYKMGMAMGTPEEEDVIMYICKCSL